MFIVFRAFIFTLLKLISLIFRFMSPVRSFYTSILTLKIVIHLFRGISYGSFTKDFQFNHSNVIFNFQKLLILIFFTSLGLNFCSELQATVLNYFSNPSLFFPGAQSFSPWFNHAFDVTFHIIEQVDHIIRLCFVISGLFLLFIILILVL